MYAWYFTLMKAGGQARAEAGCKKPTC